METLAETATRLRDQARQRITEIDEERRQLVAIFRLEEWTAERQPDGTIVASFDGIPKLESKLETNGHSKPKPKPKPKKAKPPVEVILSPSLDEMHRFIVDRESTTTDDLVKHLGISRASVHTASGKLVKMGVIRRIDQGVFAGVDHG